MPNKLTDKDLEFDTCPACDSDNIFEDEGWWYCNACGEVWEEGENV